MEIKLIDGSLFEGVADIEESGQTLTFVCSGYDYAVPFTAILWIRKKTVAK